MDGPSDAPVSVSPVSVFDTRRRSRFNPQQQREAAQSVQDLMESERLPRHQALEQVARERGTTRRSLEQWCQKFDVDLGYVSPRLTVDAQRFTLDKREDVVDRQYAAVSLLTDRILVWLSHPGHPDIPEGWNAAAELRQLTIAAAVLHDKRTLIEDLKVTRGIRDLDSEELKDALAVGRARMLELSDAHPG